MYDIRQYILSNIIVKWHETAISCGGAAPSLWISSQQPIELGHGIRTVGSHGQHTMESIWTRRRLQPVTMHNLAVIYQSKSGIITGYYAYIITQFSEANEWINRRKLSFYNLVPHNCLVCIWWNLRLFWLTYKPQAFAFWRRILFRKHGESPFTEQREHHVFYRWRLNHEVKMQVHESSQPITLQCMTRLLVIGQWPFSHCLAMAT